MAGGPPANDNGQWLGPHGTIVLYPVRRDELINVVCHYDDEAYRHMGISSMNGKTDDSGETVRLSDFKTLLAYAQQHHLARFTFWAVNRDRGCGGSNTDGDTCSGISQSAYDFTKVIAQYRR